MSSGSSTLARVQTRGRPGCSVSRVARGTPPGSSLPRLLGQSEQEGSFAFDSRLLFVALSFEGRASAGCRKQSHHPLAPATSLHLPLPMPRDEAGYALHRRIPARRAKPGAACLAVPNSFIWASAPVSFAFHFSVHQKVKSSVTLVAAVMKLSPCPGWSSNKTGPGT